MSLLSYADIIGMNYIPASAGIVLSPEEQTMACQAVACFNFSELWSDYDTYADEIDALVASTQNSLLTTEIPPAENMSSSLVLFPPTATVITGNVLLFNSNINQRFANYYNQNAPAVNDNFRWTRFISQGDWAYRVTGVRFNSSGVLNILVSNIGLTVNYLNDSHDFYNAATTFNYAVTGTFTIPAAQEVNISMRVPNKNGSSSNYGMYISSVEMWRIN